MRGHISIDFEGKSFLVSPNELPMFIIKKNEFYKNKKKASRLYVRSALFEDKDHLLQAAFAWACGRAFDEIANDAFSFINEYFDKHGSSK